MDRLNHENGRLAFAALAGAKTFRVVNEMGENIDQAVCRQMSDGRWLHVDEVDGYCILTEHEYGNLTTVPDETTSEQEEAKAYKYACADQGCVLTFAEWLAQDKGERSEWENGAAGIPTA